MPVPPPWRENDEGDGWVNDITEEVSLEHPLKRVLEKRSLAATASALVVSGAEGGLVETKDDSDALVPGGKPATGGAKQLVPLDNESARKLTKASNKALRGRYSDYRCLWKEKGLFGETNSYGLVMRYYEDGSTDIKFDGVDGMWVATQLEGHYGPIEKIDLFVGAKIKIFGRHLSINSTGASTTHWIEEEGKRLMKQQNWLQERVESVGKVPIIRRPPPIGPLSFSGRSSKPAGGDNLRMITVNNGKLLEQLATLGMSHCGNSMPGFWTSEHFHDSQSTIRRAPGEMS
jgi:hypothetical protein